jgi:hypothetical protein
MCPVFVQEGDRCWYTFTASYFAGLNFLRFSNPAAPIAVMEPRIVVGSGTGSATSVASTINLGGLGPYMLAAPMFKARMPKPAKESPLLARCLTNGVTSKLIEVLRENKGGKEETSTELKNTPASKSDASAAPFPT